MLIGLSSFTFGTHLNQLYPLGFSKNGHFAYLVGASTPEKGEIDYRLNIYDCEEMEMVHSESYNTEAQSIQELVDIFLAGGEASASIPWIEVSNSFHIIPSKLDIEPITSLEKRGITVKSEQTWKEEAQNPPESKILITYTFELLQNGTGGLLNSEINYFTESPQSLPEIHSLNSYIQDPYDEIRIIAIFEKEKRDKEENVVSKTYSIQDVLLIE